MLIDPYLRVDLISSSPNPQKVAYADAHQCYSEEYVADEFFGSKDSTPNITWTRSPENEEWHDPFSSDGGTALTEKEAGERLIKHCLKHRHWGVTESPQITFNVGYFPHTVMQQARTHRIGVTFNVQSGRYTSKRIMDVVEGKRDVQEVFYTRPVGEYDDRKGTKYTYSERQRNEDLADFYNACVKYKALIELGFSEEHAREICIPYAIRQHFTCSFNIRSLFHFLDMRTPLDAQLEIRILCDLMWPHVEAWIPELAEFYYDKRWSRNQLAP